MDTSMTSVSGLPPAAALFIAAVSLAGCAATPEACDPTVVRSVGQSLGCQVSGANRTRVDEIQARVDATIADYQLERSRLAQLEAEAAGLAADETAWRLEQARVTAGLDRLQLRLASIRVEAADEAAERDALQRSLDAARDDFTAGVEIAETEAEIAELTQAVERRRAAIEAYLEALEVEV